ncbi:MAG: cation diffusion facilitator family transporter [Pyrinomonadaceae bacterium]
MTDTGKNLTKFAWLSIAAAVTTILLKYGAYFLTGSVGLLSDALESLINLVAAIIALIILKLAAKPPDDEHMFGHGKAEYFSSGLEGSLILIAAISIVYAAIGRLFYPREIEQVGFGLVISLVATAVNLFVARILLRAAKETHSIVLEADGHHLMTDVWTSVGVVLGIGIVKLTGWWRLDPVIAIAVAINILWSGWSLISRSVQGLMDVALPQETTDEIVAVLDKIMTEYDARYEELRTRQAGSQKFISFHLLVPNEWSVERAHVLTDLIEDRLEKEIVNSVSFIHIEPIKPEAEGGNSA